MVDRFELADGETVLDETAAVCLAATSNLSYAFGHVTVTNCRVHWRRYSMNDPHFGPSTHDFWFNALKTCSIRKRYLYLESDSIGYRYIAFISGLLRIPSTSRTRELQRVISSAASLEATAD